MLIICKFSTAATYACSEHLCSLVLAYAQSLFAYPRILPNVQDVAPSTSVDVVSCPVLYPPYVCYVRLVICPPLLYCFQKNVLQSLLQVFWDSAKLCLYHIAHLICCYQQVGFVTADNFHSMNHLLLAAISARDRARNAVLFTLLYIQRYFIPRHEFSHRLHMLINKIICIRAYSVYQFAVYMINLQHPVTGSSSASRDSWRACFKLA